MDDAFFAPVMDVLGATFGYSELRPGQDQAIGEVLAGRNVLTVMPTGSGKSLCYQIPALLRDGLAVVVSPLVSLMRDQVAALTLSGVAAGTINSDISRDINVETWRAVQRGDIRILYLSPERLMTGQMLGALGKLKLSLIAIDEAHCISQWGPAFRPEYEDLSRLRDVFPGVPLIALTATADPPTQRDIAAKIFNGDGITIATGFDRPNLSLAVTLKKNWKDQVRRFVSERQGRSGIVYCLSRKKTEEVAALLREDGHIALSFHAGMDNQVKSQVQDRFMTEPGVIIVATIAFGMGIDKPDIRYVLHTDLPANLEAYYQEIGRAGRDGEPAETQMLYGLQDIGMRRTFIEQEDSDSERKRREHKRLDALLAYCEAPLCRRQTLLAYFGEDSSACGNCDLCLDPVETTDATTDAQMVLSAVHRTGHVFGAAHIINVLIGKETDKIIQRGHDQLSTFGVGAERPANEWNGIIRQMVATGLLEIDITGYGGLRATEAGRQLMAGEGEFRFRPDRIAKSATRRSRRAPKDEENLDAAANALLLQLKDLRRTLAQERGVPAYVIFSDRSLVDMAARRPADENAFADIFGVGQKKVETLAEPFLAAIRDFELDN